MRAFAFTAVVVAFAGSGCQARAAELPADQVVARVVLGKGTCTVLRGGAKSQAAVDFKLALTDQLEVPIGGVLLVELLKNHQVVRLDEDLVMVVGALAMIDAPVATESLKQQLERLLRADERKVLNERMTGWYANTSAADVPSARRQAAGASEPMAQPPSPQGGARPAPPTVQPGSAAPQEARADGTSPQRAGGASTASKAESKKRNVASDEKQAGNNFGDADTYGGPKTGTAPERKVVTATVPQWVPAEQAEVLRTCLAGEVNRLGPALKDKLGPTLFLRVKFTAEGTRIQLEGALAVPQCAQTWFEGHPPPAAQAAQWQSFEIGL